ncbi:MAG: TniB family NTP-binding protein, partial [Victivallaceae bacterium]
LGKTGRSKTLTASHWLQHNPGAIVRCRTGFTRPRMARLMAKSMTGSATGSNEANDQRIIDFLDAQEDYTVIIDEANYLIDNQSSQKAKDSLNYLRDAWEITGKAHVLIFTNYTLKDLKHGVLGDFLEQFRGRMGYNLQIPERLFRKSEVEPIVKAYVPNPNVALLNQAYDIAAGGDGKIRTLVKYLDLAKDYIANEGGSINAELLEALRERYDDGGTWPED